ncbi:MAG: D-alanyl-D-alanine carboxypeptidase/D-alanyl-D-alanine-endopeptidase [Planctomycetes bacterium]|nr:D-alanyl-D-alanine carboxypeptidase/D-alanyl-D-alanine-endopeptidase [Planctomycetota bacterium]
MLRRVMFATPLFSRRRKIPFALISGLLWQFAVCLPCHAGGGLSQVESILRDPKLDKVVTGIHIVDVDTGKVVFKRNSDRLFAPASNMKLVTTAAALHYLGPDYTFRTAIYRNGEVRGGTLHGDLIIRGSGDPNISGRFYGENITAIPDTLARTIREGGIRVVAGDIVADDTLFDREYIHPEWPKDQLWRWYCAPVCGLSFNDNCVEVEVQPGNAPGEPARLSAIPPTSYIEFENECVTTGSKRHDMITIDRTSGEPGIKVGGRCWSDAGPRKFFVTVDNPALFFATVFRESLGRAGVEVKGRPRVAVESLAQVEVPSNEVAAFAQHHLKETIAVTNKRSQNFYAEQLLKLIGCKVGGAGSFDAGVSVCARFLKQIGIPAGSYRMVDGCGLADTNRLSPAQITRLLCAMWRHKYNKVYVASLARPGEDGSLRRRFKDKRYHDRICGKTGYIDSASALSGYLSTDSGRIYAFSILMNDPKHRALRVPNYELRRIQDKICIALIES